jgi:hypothetical protein
VPHCRFRGRPQFQRKAAPHGELVGVQAGEIEARRLVDRPPVLRAQSQVVGQPRAHTARLTKQALQRTQNRPRAKGISIGQHFILLKSDLTMRYLN